MADVLGSGGMGLVYRAFDPALKRWVAIKVLAPNLAGDPTARPRFAREAQAAAAVRHEHVVAIHAVSDIDGLPYIVMEYLAGGSLQDYLDLNGPPSWRTAARLAVQIASGLAAAHAKGLIHRDIKPSNILLQAEGTADDLGVAKLSDFGLARVADESRLTQTGLDAGHADVHGAGAGAGEALITAPTCSASAASSTPSAPAATRSAAAARSPSCARSAKKRRRRSVSSTPPFPPGWPRSSSVCTPSARGSLRVGRRGGTAAAPQPGQPESPEGRAALRAGARARRRLYWLLAAGVLAGALLTAA